MLSGWDGQFESSSKYKFDDTSVGFGCPESQGLTSLRTLNLSGCKNLADVRILEAFSQLDNLTCSSLPVEELPDLRNFPRLKYLYLSDCTRLRRLTLTSIDRLMALLCLDLDGCISLEELPDLGMFPALQKLLLEGCSGLTTLSSSEQLPALKVLDASRCRGLSRVDLDQLQALCPQCRINGIVE